MDHNDPHNNPTLVSRWSIIIDLLLKFIRFDEPRHARKVLDDLERSMGSNTRSKNKVQNAFLG